MLRYLFPAELKFVKRVRATLLLLTVFQCAEAQVDSTKPGGKVQPGYILYAPLHSQKTHLIDKEGKSVHAWRSQWLPAQSAYLLPDGNLLRTGVDSSERYFPRSGGWIELLDIRSKVLWSYLISDQNERRHHDIYPMANGNILVLVWVRKSRKQAIAAGRDPNLLGDAVWTEKIIEIRPKGQNSADVVWEWNVWDHLVQDHDRKKQNYGKVSESANRIDINFLASSEPDWLHFNAISYNAKTDQILVSCRNFSEFFVIDHSTSRAQAATGKGGKSGKGGDILYRWGNPASYKRGTDNDQKLFSQHNVHWVPAQDGGEDHIMIFNNGLRRPGGEYSSIDVLKPPYTKTGGYHLEKGRAYLPDTLVRQYKAENPGAFYSHNVSSAEQLPNGNILVCEGAKGKFFEIDPNDQVVWTYVNSFPNNNEELNDQPKGPIFKCVFYEPSYTGVTKLMQQKKRPSEK